MTIAGDLAQAAADPVAGDGVADLLADGETHPDDRRRLVGRDRSGLEHEAGHGAAASGLDAQEIPTIWQTPGANRRHGQKALG